MVVACCLLRIVNWLVGEGCVMLHVDAWCGVRCALFLVGNVLSVVCCASFAICRLLFVVLAIVRWTLSVVGCCLLLLKSIDLCCALFAALLIVVCGLVCAVV